MTTSELASIAAAEPVPVDPAEVAEALALGSRATDVQRQALQQRLVGSVVEWNVPVYEVSLRDGWYIVVSDSLPARTPNPTSLVHVVAYVVPRNSEDTRKLVDLRSGDRLTLRGRVRSVTLRTAVEIGPALVVQTEIGGS